MAMIIHTANQIHMEVAHIQSLLHMVNQILIVTDHLIRYNNNYVMNIFCNIIKFDTKKHCFYFSYFKFDFISGCKTLITIY